MDGAGGYPIHGGRRSALRASARADAVICDASLRQALVCARSLGRAGLKVALLESSSSAPAFHSRWCSTSGVVASFATDPDSFVADVVEQATAAGARVVVPLHDGSIDALCGRRAEVERDVALALAGRDALELAASKDRTLALAERLGIPVPRSFAVRMEDDVRAAAREIGFPLIVKPAASWVQGSVSGRRLACRLVTDLDQALETVEDVAHAGGKPILQEWLIGAREAVSLFRADGRIWARFAQVAHRMSPPVGGSSVVRESIPLPPQLARAAEELVDACDLDGYSEVEFRRDAAGCPRLMEINARLSASVEIAVRAGVDFPLLLFRWAAGERLRAVDGFRTGVRMRWLGGDLTWLRMTLAAPDRPESEPAWRAVGSFCVEFLRGSSYDYLDHEDLRPAVAATASWVHRACRSVARGRRRGSAP
jgi:predicted ATP-grasp superfamily ATP-dependent carboligase